MNELKVTQTLGAISFNFEELKAEVQSLANDYASLVYTDDVISEAKEDRAKLNKLKTALNDERKRREKEFNEPFQQFKSEINTLIGIIDEPISTIDQQIKEYEALKKDEKKQTIENYFDGLVKPDFLKLHQIWNEKWLNASTTMKSVQADIDALVSKVATEMETIKSLPTFAFEAMEEYKRTLDLSQAIAEGQRLADIQRRKEEQKKAEEEKKAAEVKEEVKEEPKEEQIPFYTEPDDVFIPNFDAKVKMMVEVPENKLEFIGKWLEDNGCTIQIV